ncbi:hypothetical protein D9619_002046 [Psilocybe cf. subviscida]|uniref:Uncharacterized protein n=1 Tax=Psilocybe cf. subviscida TaxID=2480587 RepID=A0A8H5BE14_9AGAR|nr:hypothetical protein D9619_002046 [Psilocybe cf. subviscida]
MPSGAIGLPINDFAMPEMAYADDSKAPLLPVPASMEHAEQGCNCTTKCAKKKSRARRAFRHVVFMGLTFLLVKAAFAHFDFKPWSCGTSTTFGNMGFAVDLNPLELPLPHLSTPHNPPTHPDPPTPPHSPHRDPHSPHDRPQGDWFYDIPSGLELGDCVTGENFEEEESDGHLRAASAQFEISKADTLFFLSRGQLSAGSVRILSSPDQASDSATVKVTARYILDEVRDLAKACPSTRGKDARGIGLFTPNWHHNHPRDRDHIIYFEMTITLPEGSEDSPLSINNFETDVPNTTHAVDDLSKISFSAIKLAATNGPFIQASSLTVGTTNSPISGRFNTTDSVELITTNGPIKATVGLHNKDDKTLSLVAETSNGPLDLIVAASSSTDQPGAFDVNAHTANGPLSVNLLGAPVNFKWGRTRPVLKVNTVT